MNWISPIDFFTHPVLFSPTIGSMLMGICSALVGVLVYIQRRSLVGETLSHATYPGIVSAIALFSPFFTKAPESFPFFLLGGAFLSGLLGLKLIHYLEERLSVNSDTALCFVLSTFLGVGVLVASRLQFTQPVWFQKVQALLYGQSATMLLVHVYIYLILASLISLFIALHLFSLKMTLFDRNFAKVIGISLKWIDYSTITLLLLAIIIGIRSVGVVLMAGMLIAPAAAARQFCKTFSQMLCLSALLGIAIGFLGNFFSVNLSIWLQQAYGEKISLPTGPMILVFATLFVFLALIFSKDRGLISCLLRKKNFQIKCVCENILKHLYKNKQTLSSQELKELLHISKFLFFLVIKKLRKKNLITKKVPFYSLTEDGAKQAKRILRRHRLWEVYLFTCLDIQAGSVHKSAEEMEHILTPELEEKLAHLLKDPKVDPHNQTIPDHQE